MKTITLDDDIYAKLQTLATPLEDTASDVIRRLLRSTPEGTARQNLSSADPTGTREPRNGDSVAAGAVVADGRRTGRRQRGDEARLRLVRQLQAQGVHISHQHGILYSSPSGSKAAIPFATPWKPGRWFLGAPERLFNGAVGLILLCEENGQLLDFAVPRDQVNRLMPRLTKVDHQVKFNVKRSQKGYELLIPQQQPEVITAYLHGSKQVLC